MSTQGDPSPCWVHVTGLDPVHVPLDLSLRMPLEVDILTLTSQDRKMSLGEE